jgi:hypothetical protein
MLPTNFKSIASQFLRKPHYRQTPKANWLGIPSSTSKLGGRPKPEALAKLIQTTDSIFANK